MAAARKSKNQPFGFADRLRELPWPGLRTAATLAVAVGLVATGIGLAERRAGELIERSSPEIRYHWAEATIAGQAAAWPPPTAQFALIDRANAIAEQRGGPFASSTLAGIADSLERSGWVDSVHAVTREPDGSIAITARWRQPAAVLRQNGRDHAISSEGRRLPVDWLADTSTLPVIFGARGATPAADVTPGAFWPDVDVSAGAELLVLLHQELGSDPAIGARGFDQVVGVDVSRYRTLRQLLILTDRGSTIVWGRAPSDPVQDIVDTPTKLSRLANLRTHPDYGKRIDAGLDYLDLSSGPILVESRTDPGDDPQ